MKENTITYKNSEIFYRTTGEGKFVVLIHGVPFDGTIWDGLASFLNGRFRLIIPDLPGSGRSQMIPDATIETYAEVIKFILDIEIEKSLPGSGTEAKSAAIIGHSMGGYITVAFAEKYARYIDSFGLFHSTALADDDEKKKARAKTIGRINENGSLEFIKTSLPGLFARTFTENFPGVIKDLVEKGKTFTTAALAQYQQAMMERPDRTAILKQFNKPVLFVIGEHDSAVPLQSSLRQCYFPAQSRVHILERSGHMGMLEEDDKANNIIIDFLS